MSLEFKSSGPIYLQLMQEFKKEIVSEIRKPGDKIESVRDLSRSLGVSPGTIQRAFLEMEREGLLYTKRTNGRYVTQDTARIDQLRRQFMMEMVADFVEQMRESGVKDTEILDNVQQYLEGVS
ncbi:MAG TPA: GntR family transcriptional regulator [Ruminococcaceae bacterium]|nr:GntR family transcriptional regulator [Oscillospiraceae bacterium]